MQEDQFSILSDFNNLLEEIYSNNLNKFCQEYNNKQDIDSFYKRVQKSRNRMGKQSVSDETIDTFRKYIIFLRSKKIENSCSQDEWLIFKQAIKFFQV